MSRSMLIRDRLFECIHNGEIDHQDLVQIFKHLMDILNISTLSDYARINKISYQGALKRKLEILDYRGIKLIIDND